MGKYKQLRKSQVAMEFVFLVGLAFLTMVVFISSTRGQFDDLRGEEERSRLKDLSIMIANELTTASTVGDGFSRTFVIPDRLNNINYTIAIINNVLIAQTDDFEYSTYIPNVIGNIKKGNNTINKSNNILYLN